VLSCVIADAAITDPEARILICLLQNAVGGIVRGLKVADLGRRCGMPEAKTSKTLHGLASKGYVRSRQERRYQPNTYEIPFLSSTGFKNEGAQ